MRMRSASFQRSLAGNLICKIMATKKTAKKTSHQSRLWLMYPPRLITTPVVWELAHKFPLVTNIRQASVTDEIGVVCLELSGERDQIKAAIKWLEKMGVKVEPVEINVIES
jgi:L-aspartate semialdehyde sulfurtransferase ferredoxin